MVKNFSEVIETVKGLPLRKIAVAVAQDEAVLEAVKGAREQNLADFILVGHKTKIEKLALALSIDLEGMSIIDEQEEHKAAYRAVELVSSGQADVVMKGMIHTAELLRAVLDKEIGLRTGRVLSHAGIFEIPGFNRLLIVTDGGMNIFPSLQQKADIIQNSVLLAQAMGITPAKVAVLGAVEVVNPDMPATIEAAALAKMAERGQIQGAIVDGPLAFDNAINEQAAIHKGIKSLVAGKADILLVPDIQSGNILGKSLTYCANAVMAGLLLGAAKPVIVTSRADSCQTKIMSIAFGALLGRI